MPSVTEWARDLLASRGALVEAAEGDALRALLPQELAATLATGDWLSLNFGTSAGADDPVDWMERLAQLLPSSGLVTGVRMRFPASMPPRIDADSVLARELIIQNGIYRLVENYGGSAQYFIFTFHYTVDSDERSSGLVRVGLNATARSHVPQVHALWSVLQSDVEDDPDFQAPVELLVAMEPFGMAVAEDSVRPQIRGLEETANRRLARDAERVESYYRGMLTQIRKRITRKAGDAAAAAKEQSRADATETDRKAKLDDLVRKYSLRVQFRLTSVLVTRLPVREVVVRLIRKKEERTRTLHWNTVLKRLEHVMCEKCGRAAHPLHLCDKVHCLCAACYSPCEKCGRTFCRVCQSRCKCAAS